MSAAVQDRESQRQAALRRANEVTSRRHQLKEALAGGQVHIEDLLQSPPEWALRMAVADVLLACPRIWRVKAHRALVAAQADELVTVEALGPRRRELLLSYLHREHPGPWALWNAMVDGENGG